MKSLKDTLSIVLTVCIFVSGGLFFKSATAAPDIDNDNGAWVDGYNDIAGVFTTYSNGIAHNGTAGLIELNGATDGYFTTVKIDPPGFDAWFELEVLANRSVQSQVSYEVYYDDQGSLPPLATPAPILSGVLPLSGRVDLSSLDVSRGAIRVRILLDGNLPIPKPSVDQLKVTWNPRSVVLLDKLGPDTVTVGNNILYLVRYSVSYVEAKDLVVYDTLPTVGGTNDPDSTVVYPGDYGQDDAPFFDPTKNTISDGGQYTAGGTTVNGVVIPPNSIYWDLGNVAAGTAGTLQFNLSTTNGDLGRHSDETGTVVNNIAHSRTSNADDASSPTFSTEYVGAPSPHLLKTPGNNIGSIDGAPTALSGTTIEYIFKSPLGPTDNNNWAQSGRETMYESVLYDDVSDFAGKLNTGYGTSGFDISGGGIYSATYTAPDGSGPFPAVYWDIGTLTPGANFDRRFTVQPICPGGNPTTISNTAYLDSARTDPVSSQFDLNVVCTAEPGWNHYKADELNGHRGVTGVKTFDDDTYLLGLNTNWATYGENLKYLLSIGNSGFTDNHDGFIFDRIEPISTTLTSIEPFPAGFTGQTYYSTNTGFTDELTPPDYDNNDPLVDIDTGANTYWEPFDPLNPPVNITETTWIAWYFEEIATGMLDSSVITDSAVVGFDVLIEPIDNVYACEARTYSNTSSAAMWQYDNGSALVSMGAPPATTNDTEITYIRPEVGVFELEGEISPGSLPIPGQSTYTLSVRNLNVSGSDTFVDTYVDLNWSQISVYGAPQYPAFVSVDGGIVDFGNGAEFDPANGFIRVNLGPMVPGESKTITLELQLAAGSINQESYSVDAMAVGTDNICDPATATIKTIGQVTNGPKLEIIKNDVLNIINAGSELTYTLRYRNTGSGASINTIIGDRVPESMVFVGAEEPAGTSFYVSTDTDLPPAELASDPLTFDLVTTEFTPAPGGVCPFASAVDCERITWVAWLVDDTTLDPPQLPSDRVFREARFKVRNDEDSTAAQVDSLAGTLIFNTSAIFSDNSLPAISNETVTTITDTPSLDLEKSAQAEVSSGDTMDYVITYKNASEADNPTVWITDTLPVGAIYLGSDHGWNAFATANGAPADNNSQTVPTNLVTNIDGTTDVGFQIAAFRNGNLLSDEGGVITITVQVDPTVFRSGDLLTNSVCGRSYNNSGDVSYICDEAITEVVNADLQVIKQVDEGQPQAGSTVTWLLNISNEGRKEATNTVIQDTLPPNVTYVANSASILTQGYVFMTGGSSSNIDPVVSGTPATGQVLEFSVANGNAIGQDGQAAGYFAPTSGAVYLSFQTTLDGGIAPGTTMTNRVNVSTDSVEDVSDTCPITECPNEDTATITTPLPDPTVIKTGPAFTDPGAVTEWTLSYRNQNNETASNVYLIDTLPDHNSDDLTDLQFIATSGDRPSGAIPASDIYFSDAVAVPAFDPTGPSGDWTNDVSTLANQPRHIAYIVGTLEARSTVYQIKASGILSDPATGDPLAAGLTLENSVTIYSDVDDDSGNNTSTASTETPGLEMALTKTGDPEGFYPGTVPSGQVAYTLEIENTGTTVAYGVKISDTLPAEVTANTPFDTVSLLILTDEDGNTVYPVDTGGTEITSDITVERVDSGSTYTWYLGLAPGNEADPTHYRKVGIPPGAKMSFDIFVTINGDTPDQTTITNPAQVIVDRQNDLDPVEKYLVNNRDTSYVNVFRADLTTDKTVVDVATGSETQTSAGNILSYTITYNNIGNTAAENAILADNLPTNTCLMLDSIDNPAGTSIEYSNDDGASWDYAPTADSNGVDCDVTDYRIVFGSAIPAPANSYGEAPANLSLPSGPLLWLDGSDESTIESTCSPTCGVSEWRDKSGNSFHFTQTVNANMPITLNNGINFDGSNDFLEFDQLPNAKDITIFIVTASDTAAYNKNGWIMSNRAANGWIAHPWAGANFDFALNSDAGVRNHFGQFPIASKTTPHVLALTFDDTSDAYQQLFNGSIVTSGTISMNRDSGTTGKYYLGSDDRSLYNYRFGDGTIYEVIIYDRAFSSAELDQASRYLSLKWSIPYTGGDNAPFDVPSADHLVCLAPLPNVSCEDGVICAPFDEGTGTSTEDISGNDFDLTLNGLAWVDNRDERGTYLDFTADSNSDYAILEDFDMPTDDFTIAFWLQLDDIAKRNDLVSYAVPGDFDEIFFTHKDGRLQVLYNNNSNWIDSGQSLPDTGWHHVAMTRQLSNGTVQFFIDGTQVYSNTHFTGVSIDTGGTIVLGQDQDNLGGGFNVASNLVGNLDDFRIYDRNLSNTEILAIADGSSETAERFKTTGTYTTTITADASIGVWDKLLVGQELPDGSSIEYEIFDAAGTTSLFGPTSAPAGYLDISAIDSSNLNLTLVARMISDNSGQTCLNEWQATYSSDEDPSFTFQARVHDQPVDPSLVHNEVSISTTTPETDLTNNDGFDDIAVETINLLVEKLVDPSAVLIGETITYTINYKNEGPGTAANVVLTDTLPISVTHVSSTPSVGSCGAPSGQSVVCDLGTVGPLASGTITVVVTADASAADEIIFNGVEIGSDTNEVTLSDNIDSVPTYVGNIANIAITKVGPNAFSNDEGTAVELSQLMTYTLSYQNNGTGNATNTIITDTLPISTTYSGYTASPAATCSESSGVFTCTLGTLAPGASGTIDLGITVNNDIGLIGTTLENITVISTNEAETTLADNSDSFENPVELKPAALSGYVWFDTDQDVDRELATGEGPIAGVEIQLTGIDIFGNSVVMTTTTDSTGFYAFSNLNPSDGTGYTLTEIQPEGYESTGSDIGQIAGVADGNAANPSADQITGILLSSGEQGQHYNFGEVAPVTIGDIVWNDYNGDGQQDDGEAVLPGVTVTLYKDGNPISTTVTVGDGTYLFTNDGTDPLYDGDYFVEFTAPVGYTFTVPNATGVSDVVDSDVDPDTNRTPTFTAGLGDNILTLDAGLLIPSSIGDTIWLDTDGDGTEDAGEPGIPGVVVTATASSGLVLTTTTDNDGFYEFAGLGADTFTITVDTSTLPGGLTQTGDPGGNSSLDDTHTETLNPGDDVDTVDFGYQGSGSIGDTVWLDLDGDGNEDAGEGGIGGVVITLTAASGFEITTTTTITGFYEFTNLPADDYTITVDSSTLPGGLTQTGDPGGGGSLDNSHPVTLSNGQDIDTVDFGYIGNSSLGDYVWQDLDGDGVQDAGEPPIPGVVLTLTQPSGAVVTATTTITGFYEFTGLGAGTYTVDVDPSTLPGGLTQTGDPGGNSSLDDSHTQVLGANENIDTVDFGYRSGGSLGDTVWYDLNNNGIEDPGEPGIPGVVISLTLPTNLVITTTTAANGFYQFTGLGTGNHTVEVDTSTLPAGLTQSGDPDVTLDDEHVYNLALNEAADTVDFGYIGSGSIGDTIWQDLDGDGLEGGSEPGIQGVVITLTTGTGGVITTTTTITGFYEFPNLPADTYTVTVDATTLPDGYGQSGDPDSTLDNTHTTILTTGEDDDTVDFGYLTGAEIGNFVWHDVNGNGIQDVGEDGLSGITVTLTVSDTGQTFTTTTNSTGHYTFTNLLPGDYQVTFIPSSAYTLTLQNEGVDPEADSDADPATGSTTFTTLVSGESDMSWDAGMYEPVSLGNFVWEDGDADGIQDFGEPGIPGIEVTLILSGTGAVMTTMTNSAGLYEFTNLPPGTYAVEFSQPDDFYPTFADEESDDALDSDMDPTTLQTPFVTLESGDVDNTLDAGFYPGSSLGDYAWEDLNGDGIQDVGEPPVPGVTVTLYLSGTGQISTTVTGPDGGYLFDGLEEGTYTVTFSSPVGYEIIDQTDAGSDDTADSDADASTGQTGPIVLGRNDDDPTIDVGLYRPASIGDTVWADENGDGIQDIGETGFQGVTVTLILSGTGIITSTVTDSDGYYNFDNLPPGDYIVQFDLPDDYIVSPFERGNDEANDSNTLFLGNQTEPITLESGENNPTIDVGLYHPLQVGNYVWFDANDNGTQDPLEIGVEDVVLRLLDGNGVPVLNPSSSGDGYVYTTTTGIGGLYTFDYLAPGDYVVEVVTENFVAWDAPLYGFLSSLTTQGTDPADPDDDSNSDDNGINSLDPVVEAGTAGLTVTLGFGSEPTGDTPTARSYIFPDTSSNLTVDFGFFEMLTLGNLIWNDQDSDGFQDAGEPGMPAGIVLELRDGNGDPILNPVTGQPITTTTQAGGLYQFTNLAPGEYVIFIAPENFLTGGPLEGYAGSAGSSDPDNDSDIDDNGIDENYPTINGIYSQPVTLGYQEEPDNFEDGDNNANTNFTVDFGLVQVPTAVELLKFEAKVIGPLEVRVAWATGSEIDNFGFRLMRSSTADFADAKEIHFESSVVASASGSTYAFWDTVPEFGTYTYWLIDVETTGRETVHPPVTVKLDSGQRQDIEFELFMPFVVR